MASPHPLRASSFGLGAGFGLLALVAGAECARAQVSFNGPEFQVNTYTTSNEEEPAVAVGGTGGFVVAWHVKPAYAFHGNQIRARLYDGGGQPLGMDFIVDSLAAYQFVPEVAIDDQGRFVIAWTSFGSNGSDSSGWSAQARQFLANGDPQGPQFQVNTYTTSSQVGPAISTVAAGNFIVVWSSLGSGGSDSSGWSVQARRFASDGQPLGDDFQVNQYTTNDQGRASVASDDQGSFVVAWRSQGSSGSDSSGYSIQARRYDSIGTPLSDQFQVNTYTSGYQGNPAVAVNGRGDFVVTWQSVGSPGNDPWYSIQARRFQSDGTPLGADFQVNLDTIGTRWRPAVAIEDSGAFVIAWHGTGEGTPWEVQARRFDASGSPLEQDFQVNTYSTGNQSVPALGMDSVGNFVVAWQSSGSSGTDSDGISIQSQRFDQLFRDGFEGGDTNRWSAAVP